MNTIKIISALALVLAMPLSACSNGTEHMADSDQHNEDADVKPVNMSTERQNVEQILTNYSKQITAKNLGAMEPFVFTEGNQFTIFEGKGTNTGWADYRDNHLAPELANEDLVFTKYDFINFNTNVSGDVAAITFSIDAAYEYKGEGSAHMGRGTAILRKVGGDWKIAHLHTS